MTHSLASSGRTGADPGRQGAALINSSGIEYDWRRVARPLPQQLLKRGLIRPGPLALGIAADRSTARCWMPRARSASRLFAMGPPLRGMWWESTAVTDVAPGQSPGRTTGCTLNEETQPCRLLTRDKNKRSGKRCSANGLSGMNSRGVGYGESRGEGGAQGHEARSDLE